LEQKIRNSAKCKQMSRLKKLLPALLFQEHHFSTALAQLKLNHSFAYAFAFCAIKMVLVMDMVLVLVLVLVLVANASAMQWH